MIDSLIINEPKCEECRIEFNSKSNNPRLMRLVLAISKWSNTQGLNGFKIEDLKFVNIDGKTFFTCKKL